MLTGFSDRSNPIRGPLSSAFLETNYSCIHLPVIVRTIRKVHSSSLLLLGPAEASDWGVYVAFLWLQTHSGQTQKPMGTKSLMQLVFSMKLCGSKGRPWSLCSTSFPLHFNSFFLGKKETLTLKKVSLVVPAFVSTAGFSPATLAVTWRGTGKCCPRHNFWVCCVVIAWPLTFTWPFTLLGAREEEGGYHYRKE